MNRGRGRGGVAALALTLTSIIPTWPLRAHGKDPVAEGRAHLRKANALAGNDRCEAAVREYTRAYEKLHDPGILFNRAECERRLGHGAAAAADYRVFLVAAPAAPNRKDVEAKLATLTAPPAPARTAPSTPPSVAPPGRRQIGSTAAPRVAVAVAPPPAAPRERRLGEDGPTANAYASPAPPSELDEAGHIDTARAEVTDASAPVDHGRLWIAIGVAAAVVAAAAGTYLVVRTPGASPPSTDLGSYKF